MIKAVVTDIEGTTSSLSFVKDVLFPYARKNMAAFIFEHQTSLVIKDLLVAVAEQSGVALTVDALVGQLLQWMDEDKKITPLKLLQGLIWEAGYKKGDFNGHIYPDAVDYLRQWHQRGLFLYVYSSGSVHAQKLLFSHTEYGDLTPLFSGYFDTQTGAKKDPASYLAIAKAINLSAGNILFLSDSKEEINAAKHSGYVTVMLNRDDWFAAESSYFQVKDFSGVESVLQVHRTG